jgi:hypothetical protein
MSISSPSPAPTPSSQAFLTRSNTMRSYRHQTPHPRPFPSSSRGAATQCVLTAIERPKHPFSSPSPTPPDPATTPAPTPLSQSFPSAARPRPDTFFPALHPLRATTRRGPAKPTTHKIWSRSRPGADIIPATPPQYPLHHYVPGGIPAQFCRGGRKPSVLTLARAGSRSS